MILAFRTFEIMSHKHHNTCTNSGICFQMEMKHQKVLSKEGNFFGSCWRNKERKNNGNDMVCWVGVIMP